MVELRGSYSRRMLVSELYSNATTTIIGKTYNEASQRLELRYPLETGCPEFAICLYPTKAPYTLPRGGFPQHECFLAILMDGGAGLSRSRPLRITFEKMM